MSPGIELVAYAGPRSSSTASSLSCGCTIDPGLDEPGEVCIGVELCLLDFARVNNVDNIVDSDGCLVGVLSIASYMKVEMLYEGGNLADLCDIGSGDNFPRFRRQEHLALFVVGEVSV